MKKQTRDLKKHDRSLHMQLRALRIDPSAEHWYNGWHHHLDMEGYSNRSPKERIKHIRCYLTMLDKVETQMACSGRDFQTWVYIAPEDGGQDALFFYTENPNDPFPRTFEAMRWDAEIPPVFQPLIDRSVYNFGVAPFEGRNFYIIQKKGLGLSL
jgi:hypothetical protein